MVGQAAVADLVLKHHLRPYDSGGRAACLIEVGWLWRRRIRKRGESAATHNLNSDVQSDAGRAISTLFRPMGHPNQELPLVRLTVTKVSQVYTDVAQNILFG